MIEPPTVAAYNRDECLLTWMQRNRERAGNIYQGSVRGGKVYVISDPEYAEHVLRRNWQNYRKGMAIKRVALLLGNGLMVSESDLWKRQRRMIQPAFHRTLVARMIDLIETANAALLKKWQQTARRGGTVNVTHDTSLISLEIILRAIFGDDYADLAPHFSLLSEDSTRDLRFAESFRSLGNLIVRAVARRRQLDLHSPDILGMLMAARDRSSGTEMSEKQLINEIMTLIVAGHETTASTLSWTWYLLSQHPEVEQKLEAVVAGSSERPAFDELPQYTYLQQVIEEVLRLYPAGWLMTRRALNDDRIDGYSISSGAEVYISPYMIQRHPDLWIEPGRFDPDRFAAAQASGRHPLAMMAFSAGPRNCIGEQLARLEMQIHVLMIVRKLRLRCNDVRPLDLDLGVNLRNKSEFVMTPIEKTAT